MPRNYLAEASNLLFRDKISLEAKVRENPKEVVINLLNVLENSQGEMQAMDRKEAAYALGQIGYPGSLAPLRDYFDIEHAQGVRDAMLASMTAIKLAPAATLEEAGNDSAQQQRCRIIEDVYHGRRPADWS
ncbi:MAG: hypothetical protein JO053_02120 [Acidobacteria bacterium]|nr:hypothetical protein [Acidobacteriota bacterium]